MWEAFEEAAKRLGLSFRMKTGLADIPVVSGELEGQRVRCQYGVSDRGSTVSAELSPALDLGLEVRQRTFVTFTGFAPRVRLGDSNWDDEVVATADEPSRAAVLFADEARRAVLGLNATSVGFEVTDASVSSYVLQPEESTLVQAFQHVARVASLVSHARKAVPPATAIEAHAKALRTVAREAALAIEETPLRVSGESRNVRLSVRFPRTGRGDFDMKARVESLEGSLGAGLRVSRETFVDRVRTFVGKQDLRTGDEAFDPSFLVQGDDEARVIAALDADVRALLLDLARRFDVVALDEKGLTLRGPVRDVPAEETATLLEAAGTVVDRVARASGAVLRGPYR